MASDKLREALHNAIGDCCFGREGTLVSWLRSPREVEQHIAERLEAALAASPAGEPDLEDELRQCLQIIITNAGNIKSGRSLSTAKRDAANIEGAVKRAAAALASAGTRQHVGQPQGDTGWCNAPDCWCAYAKMVAGQAGAAPPFHCQICSETRKHSHTAIYNRPYDPAGNNQNREITGYSEPHYLDAPGAAPDSER